VVHDRVAVLVQGVQQSAFADDEGGPVRLLGGKKTGRAIALV